jgi:hypothetical protein
MYVFSVFLYVSVGFKMSAFFNVCCVWLLQNYHDMLGNANGASVSRIKKEKAVKFPTQQSRIG